MFRVYVASKAIVLFPESTKTKALARLRKCAGWSAPLHASKQGYIMARRIREVMTLEHSCYCPPHQKKVNYLKIDVTLTYTLT